MKICIIQARMGSSRLPGKVMELLEGKEMLLHVVERARKSKVDKVVVATTVEAKDDMLANFLVEHKIEHFRGSENDVLDRYYQTAQKYQAKTIVRITSDCPMIDPVIINQVLDALPGHDYASNVIERTYPRGLDCEAFTFKILKKMWQECRKPEEREHVTWHIVANKDQYKIASVKCDTDYSEYRLTVDENADLIMARKIFASLGSTFGFDDIVKLLKNKPEIAKINAHVEQKKI